MISKHVQKLKTPLAICLAASLILAAPQQSRSQHSLWKTLFEAGLQAQRAGNTREAEKQLNAALRSADTSTDENAKLLNLRALGVLYIKDQRYDKAEECFRQALKLGQTSKVKEGSVADWRNLAFVCRKLGKKDEAEKIYSNVVALLKDREKENPEVMGTALTDLAMVYQDSANYTKVEPLLAKALQLYETSENDSAIASGLENLGNFYVLQSRLSEAEPLFKRALIIRKSGEKDTNSSKVATDISGLAEIYEKQGHAADAETLHKQTLEFTEQKHGAESIEFAESLARLGHFYQAQDQYSKALDCLQKAFAIRQKVYGGTHPLIVESMDDLGQLQLEMDNYKRAEELYKKAIRIEEELHGARSRSLPRLLNALGRVYLMQGLYDQAEPEYKRALQIVEQTEGSQHPNVATCLNNLAWLYRNQQKFLDAENALKTAQTIREKAFGPDHPVVAQNLINLADAYMARGDQVKAEPLLLRALRIDENALDPDHEYVAVIMRDLVDCYRLQDKNAEAEHYARRVLQRDEKLLGGDNPVIAGDLNSLARILHTEGKKEEAIKLKKRARSITNRLISGLPGGSSISEIKVTKPDGEAPNLGPVKDKWALVIGVSNFKDPNLNLKYAAKDATDFRNFLIKDANFQPNHVKLLTDANATRDNIVAHLGEKWLRRVANEDDLVVIYISSHGTQSKKEVGGANFIVPYDANLSNIVFNGIPMQWFTAGLKDLIHSDRICLLLDVCHSGSIEPGAKAVSRTTGIDAADLTPGSGQVILVSSKSDQISWESKKYPNSVFTRKLIEGLKQNGDRTTLKETYEFMKDSIEEEVLRDRAELQTPMFITQLWKGNELVLGAKPEFPRAGLEEPDNDVVTSSPAKSGQGAKGDDFDEPNNYSKRNQPLRAIKSGARKPNTKNGASRSASNSGAAKPSSKRRGQ